MREIKIGDKYLCNTSDYEIGYFTKGNIYEVQSVNNSNILLLTNSGFVYSLSVISLNKNFKDLQEVNEIKVNYEVVPSHYDNKQGYDVIDISKHYNLNFNRGNVVKYICRAGKKDNELQDLKKALDYLQREIQHIENK
jgi:hypothetical protein